MSYKKEEFKVELDYIEHESMKVLASNLIEQLPDYFFKVAASSTGKYHPDYAQGEGGLVRHTKAAVRIAMELLRLSCYRDLLKFKDCILIALLLHDGWKHGPITEDGSYNNYTTFSHPKVCYDWIISLSKQPQYSNCSDVLNFIANLVLTHMGQWNFDYNSGGLFAPIPQTQEQWFVHLCDYLASRKCLEMNFEIPYSD